jgi:hypothetical protein
MLTKFLFQAVRLPLEKKSAGKISLPLRITVIKTSLNLWSVRPATLQCGQFRKATLLQIKPALWNLSEWI